MVGNICTYKCSELGYGAITVLNFLQFKKMRTTNIWLVSTCLILSQVVLIHGSADPEDIRRMTAGVRKKCIAETQTTLEAIRDTEYGEFPDDEKLKCYFKCALEKLSLMDKQGTIKYHLLKKMVPDAYKEMGTDMIDSCTHITGNDKCDKAYKFFECMFEANPTIFMAP